MYIHIYVYNHCSFFLKPFKNNILTTIYMLLCDLDPISAAPVSSHSPLPKSLFSRNTPFSFPQTFQTSNLREPSLWL